MKYLDAAQQRLSSSRRVRMTVVAVGIVATVLLMFLFRSSLEFGTVGEWVSGLATAGALWFTARQVQLMRKEAEDKRQQRESAERDEAKATLATWRSVRLYSTYMEGNAEFRFDRAFAIVTVTENRKFVGEPYKNREEHKTAGPHRSFQAGSKYRLLLNQGGVGFVGGGGVVSRLKAVEVEVGEQWFRAELNDFFQQIDSPTPWPDEV